MSHAVGSPFDAFAAAPTPGRAAATPARLRACRDCGLFQIVPPMEPDHTVRCLRCNAVLRRTRRDSLTRSADTTDNEDNIYCFSLTALARLPSPYPLPHPPSPFGLWRTGGKGVWCVLAP